MKQTGQRLNRAGFHWTDRNTFLVKLVINVFILKEVTGFHATDGLYFPVAKIVRLCTQY